MIANCYYINPKVHNDFFFVWLSRMFYYMGIAKEVFIVYYLRDMLLVSIDQATKYTSFLAIIAQLSAAIIAFPIGKLSDIIGRKPLVIVACIVMSSCYIALLLVKDFWLLIAGVAFYGVGNGSYLAVRITIFFVSICFLIKKYYLG